MANDGPQTAVGRRTGNRTVDRADDRRKELAAAIESGKPLILGERLSDWTPEHDDLPPAQLLIDAETVRHVVLDRTLANHADPRGLDIQGAVIIGELDLNFATIGFPLNFINCRIANEVQLAFATLQTLNVEGSHFTGPLSLRGARIHGQLNMSRARLTGAKDGYSLLATNLQVDGNVAVVQAFTSAGAIRLLGAHISGFLSMRGATLNGADADGYGLVADNVRIGGTVFLDEGFVTARALRLNGAHVGSNVQMKGAILNGSDVGGLSLLAYALGADRDVRLDEARTAGGIMLDGARIGRELIARGAQITGVNPDGNAVLADSLQVEGNVVFDQLSTAGAIRLVGAHIGGQLILRGSTLGRNADSYSIYADDMQVDGNMHLDPERPGQEFTTTGAVWLKGAHIRGQLNLSGAKLNGADKDGNSLLVSGLQADSTVHIDDKFKANGEIRMRGADITNLHVGNDRQSLPRLASATGWRIQDLHGVIRDDRKAAAKWLDTQKVATAQPWQEIASVYERNGQPADGRWMRYQSAVRSTRKTKGLTWLARQTYRLTTAHGYYPLIALGWLLVIFVFAWGMTTALADDFTTVTTSTISADLGARAKTAAATSENPPIQEPFPGRVPASWCSSAWDVECLSPPVYALATAFPAAATTQVWMPPDGWLTVVFYVLRLLAWVFTALLLAGVTGLLRKQT